MMSSAEGEGQTRAPSRGEGISQKMTNDEGAQDTPKK